MRKKGIPSSWLSKAGSPEEAVQLEQSIRASGETLRILRSIIDSKMAELDANEVSPSSYDNPSWAFKQAHGNGYRHGLTTIRKLLEFL